MADNKKTQEDLADEYGSRKSSVVMPQPLASRFFECLDGVANKDDEIVIGAEKKGKSVEIISTSQLHALIVGTTGSGKTTGFVDQKKIKFLAPCSQFGCSLF